MNTISVAINCLEMSNHIGSTWGCRNHFVSLWWKSLEWLILKAIDAKKLQQIHTFSRPFLLLEKPKHKLTKTLTLRIFINNTVKRNLFIRNWTEREKEKLFRIVTVFTFSFEWKRNEKLVGVENSFACDFVLHYYYCVHFLTMHCRWKRRENVRKKRKQTNLTKNKIPSK